MIMSEIPIEMPAFVASVKPSSFSLSNVATLDKLKELGFTEATKAGISIGISDMIIPKEKQTELENAYKQIRQVRSEERCVGKECRYQVWEDHVEKNKE